MCSIDLDCGFENLSFFQITILGILQGVTELLPISSTAHLRLVPEFLGWQDPGSAFSAVMQLASFLAIIFYWKKDISEIKGAFMDTLKGQWNTPRFRLWASIGIGSIPIAIAGLSLRKLLNQPGSPLRQMWVLGASSVVMGLLLIYVERTFKGQRKLTDITFKDGILVGLAQVGALIPGVSRSGSTLTTSLFLGFQRTHAAAFSFLLGIPAILGAGAKELLVLYQGQLSSEGWMLLGTGLFVASISAFLGVYLLMKFIETQSTLIFGVYRIILGTVILIKTLS